MSTHIIITPNLQGCLHLFCKTLVVNLFFLFFNLLILSLSTLCIVRCLSSPTHLSQLSSLSHVCSFSLSASFLYCLHFFISNFRFMLLQISKCRWIASPRTLTKNERISQNTLLFLSTDCYLFASSLQKYI